MLNTVFEVKLGVFQGWQRCFGASKSGDIFQNNGLKPVYLQIKSHFIPKSIESTWDFYAIGEFAKPVSVLNYDYSWIYVNPHKFQLLPFGMNL